DFGGGPVSHDETPPVVTAAPATAITRESAVLEWTSDEPTRTVVRTGTGYHADSVIVALGAPPTALLTGLAPGTAMTCMLAVTDAAQNTTLTPVSFTTAPNQPPTGTAEASVTSGIEPLTVQLSILD